MVYVYGGSGIGDHLNDSDNGQNGYENNDVGDHDEDDWDQNYHL